LLISTRGKVTDYRKNKPVYFYQFGIGLPKTNFAVGFVGLFGKKEAIGEAFHITSDELLTWNQIYKMMADELGVSLNAIHIPSDSIAKYNPEHGAVILVTNHTR